MLQILGTNLIVCLKSTGFRSSDLAKALAKKLAGYTYTDRTPRVL